MTRAARDATYGAIYSVTKHAATYPANLAIWDAAGTTAYEATYRDADAASATTHDATYLASSDSTCAAARALLEELSQ